MSGTGPSPHRRGVVIDLDDEAAPRPEVAEAPPAASPATAPPVPDGDEAPRTNAARALRTAALLAARPERGVGRWFWRALGALLLFALGVAAWEFVAALMAERPWLGWIAAGLVGAVILSALAVAGREALALRRLARIDDLRLAAAAVLAANDLPGARALADRLAGFYAARPDTRWGRDELRARAGDVFDADAAVALAERTLLAPLDEAASREVEAAARQVALVTAFVPVALADVATAGAANMRMIRRVATIYGARPGTLGNWRLVRAVLTHLVATGAVAAGDDLLHSVAGGGVLARLSRRFGEGVVNGALTARVGVAAMEVCRPLPFAALHPPRVSAIVARAMTGLGLDGDG